MEAALTLRTRLLVTLVVVAVLPLIVVLVVVRNVVLDELDDRAEASSGLLLQAVAERADDVRVHQEELVRDLVAPGRLLGQALADTADVDVEAALADAAAGDRTDLAVVVRPDGTLVAAQVGPVSRASELEPPATTDLAAAASAGAVPAQVLGAVRRLVRSDSGELLGYVLVGRWVDDDLAADLQGGMDGDVTVLVAGEVAGTSRDRPPDPAEVDRLVAGGPSLALDGSAVAARAATEGALTLVATTPRTETSPVGTVTAAVLILAAAALVLSAVLAVALSRFVTSPLQRLAEESRAVVEVATGRAVEPGSGTAGVRASQAVLVEELRDTVGALHGSREALRESLELMGRTLASSLDLDATLSAIVDVARTGLQADRAALHLYRSGRQGLHVEVGRNLPAGTLEHAVEPGEGFVGWVAETARVARLPQDLAASPALGAADPPDRVALAVPLVGSGDGVVIGVLSLWSADRAEFDDRDVEAMRSFAAHASVAIGNVQLHEATARASVTDELTGLRNVRYFHVRAAQEVERAERFDQELSLLMADLDHFKRVNDQHGHRAGDAVLRAVADRLSRQVREVDTAARYGGEEFAVLLPQTASGGARLLADRIRRSVAGAPIDADGVEVRITISLGVATFPDDGGTVEELVGAADAALYEAKARGRDRVVVAGEPGVEA